MAAGTSDIVDALVVVTALVFGRALFVTSDPEDLARIADALRADLDLYPV